MHPKDTDGLKTWLTVKLRPLCDADPLALAKYVFALIRKDKPTDTLRELCIDQLEVFLGRETLNFVSELFDVLENGVPDMKETINIPESGSDSDGSSEKEGEKAKAPRVKKTTSEDLKYSELDDEDRDFKRARKEDDSETKSAISPITFPSSNSAGLLKRKRNIEEGRSLPRKTSRIRPPPLLPDAAKYVPSNSQPMHKPNAMEKKQRCKDYDEKGFCLLGENCPYDHGLDPLVVESGSFPPPPLNVPSTFFPPVPPQYLMVPPPPSLLPQAMNMPPKPPPVSVDADTIGYNPEQPALSLTSVPSTMPLSTNTSSTPVLYTPAVSTTVSSQSGERPRMSRNHRTGGGYFQRTPQEPTNTLVLRRVPPELNVLSKLNSHFDQFGKIVNLKVGFQNDSEAALVQFSTVAEAKAAHSSSSAVLGNRFIRVYFMRAPRYQSVTPNTMSVSNICNKEKSNSETLAEVSSSNTVEDKADKTTPADPNNLPNGKPEVSTTTVDEDAAVPKVTDTPTTPTQQNITKHLPTSPTITTPVSAELIKKQKQLHLKMKGLLDDQLKQQKALITKLENGRKTLTADEKKKVMEMVKTLSTNITKLKAQILHQQAQVKAPLKESAPVKAAEKPPVPAQTEPAKKPMDLRNKLRRRTREIVICNVAPEMKEKLTGMFEKLGGLVQVRYDPLRTSDIIFTFKTQVDAKKAVDNGSVFDSKPLIMKWYYPKEDTITNRGVIKERRTLQNATELQSPTTTDDARLLGETIDLPDDDEEEVESEERSWKR